MSAACVALAVLLGGTPEGAAMLDVVSEASEFERRQRRLVGAFAVTTGAGQVATGAILLDSAENLGDPLSRSGRLNVIAGSAAIVQGVVTLAQPGPLRRLRKTPAYARLVAHPESPWASRAFDREWAVAARRTRRWRLWIGGVSIVAGATLTTLAAVRTFAVARTPAHTVLDVSMLATGAGLLGTGVSGVVLKSEMERAYARQGARRTRLRAGVGAGTVSLSGRF